MTGMEAWHLVAPLIAAHSVAQHVNGGPELNVLDEAYIIVFGALKEHDERRNPTVLLIKLIILFAKIEKERGKNR